MADMSPGLVNRLAQALKSRSAAGDIAARLNSIDALSEAELGVLDGVTAGTVTESKALVVDENKDIATIRHLSISGNFVTGSTTLSEAELGVLDSIAASTADLNETATLPTSNSTIALNAGGAVTQTATIQLKDADDANLSGVHVIEVYMCTDSAGATPSSAGAQVSAAPTTGAAITTLTAKLHWSIATDASAVAVLTFDNTGGGGAYTDRVVLKLPSGAVVVSDALNVATA